MIQPTVLFVTGYNRATDFKEAYMEAKRATKLDLSALQGKQLQGSECSSVESKASTPEVGLEEQGQLFGLKTWANSRTQG